MRSPLNILLAERRTHLTLPRATDVWREAYSSLRSFFRTALPIFFAITIIASLLDASGMLPYLATGPAACDACFRSSCRGVPRCPDGGDPKGRTLAVEPDSNEHDPGSYSGLSRRCHASMCGDPIDDRTGAVVEIRIPSRRPPDAGRILLFTGAGMGRTSLLALEPELARRGRKLLHEQCSHWGADIRREEGNLLIEYGFERYRPPAEDNGCSQ